MFGGEDRLGGPKRPGSTASETDLAELADAPVQARAIVLADKLHNLISIAIDLREGRPVWNEFHAEQDQVLWYYDAMIVSCGTGDPRLVELAAQCRNVLGEIARLGRLEQPQRN